MSEVTIGSIEELLDFPLFEKIKSTFETAQEAKHLVFSDSHIKLIEDDQTGMTYELKIVEGLALRPSNRPSTPGTAETKTDASVAEVKAKNPFMNPEPELTVVGNLCDKYRIIMNKFPNAPYHFLMVTKEFVPQDTLLQPLELCLIHSILSKVNDFKINKTNNKFFAFFNSGSESGYSQFHKHIQVISVNKDFPLFPDDLVRKEDWFIPNESKPSAKQYLINKKLTFKHFVLPLPQEKEIVNDSERLEEILSMMYMSLVRQLLNVCRDLEIPKDKVSYNFIMTTDWMMIIPRRKAFYNKIWQNSLGFMGLFNGRNEEVVGLMQETGFGKILQECGVPLEGEDVTHHFGEYNY